METFIYLLCVPKKKKRETFEEKVFDMAFGQEYYTEKLKAFKKEHKEKGLCRYCNEKAEEGKTSCKYHLDYHKFYKKFVTTKNKQGGETK